MPLETSVTKDGVTWTFSQPATVGQFINGDYFVIGPVRITQITPTPTPANGRYGSDLNLPCDNAGVSPFDNRVQSKRYRENMRIYPPFDMEPGDTLISSISSEAGFTRNALLRPNETYNNPVQIPASQPVAGWVFIYQSYKYLRNQRSLDDLKSCAKVLGWQ